MTATCTVCGHEPCKVAEQHTQATRREPMRSLGFHGYCPECAVSFRVETPQLTLGEGRMNTASERVIERAKMLAPMLRERVHVYSAVGETWLASASTARELYHDRTPIFTAQPR